jgi:hypothetical protein
VHQAYLSSGRHVGSQVRRRTREARNRFLLPGRRFLLRRGRRLRSPRRGLQHSSSSSAAHRAHPVPTAHRQTVLWCHQLPVSSLLVTCSLGRASIWQQNGDLLSQCMQLMCAATGAEHCDWCRALRATQCFTLLPKAQNVGKPAFAAGMHDISPAATSSVCVAAGADAAFGGPAPQPPAVRAASSSRHTDRQRSAERAAGGGPAAARAAAAGEPASCGDAAARQPSTTLTGDGATHHSEETVQGQQAHRRCTLLR